MNLRNLIALFFTAVCSTAPIHASEPALFSEAFGAYKAGEYAAATQAVESLLQEHPDSIPGLELQGKILLAMEKPDEAIQKYLRVLELQPERSSTFQLIADAAFQQRQWPLAYNFYAKFYERNRDNKDAVLQMIYCTVAMNDLVNAARMTATLDPYNPDHPGYYFAKAALARAAGNEDEMTDLIRQARTLYGTERNRPYLAGLATIFRKTEEPQPDSHTNNPTR